MGLESPTYIDDLNTLWPLGTDKKYEGDNHLRNMKSVLQNTFKKKDGSTVWDAGISVDPLDVQNGYVPIGGIIMWNSTIASIPTTGGGATWALCNGLSSTPDLRDRFVIGAYADEASAAKTSVSAASAGGDGSPSNLTQTNTLVRSNTGLVTSSSTAAAGTTDGTAITVAQMPAHTHPASGSISKYWVDNGGGGESFTSSGSFDFSRVSAVASQGGGDAHTHTFTGDGHTHTHAQPNYYALAFMMRTA